MSNVKPIPSGYHSITPFLNLTNASDAIAFYKKAFGAEELFRMPTPDGKIMHAEIQIGDSRVMVSDAIQMPATHASLHLYVKDSDAAFAKATQAGAKVLRPLETMFWGDRYGLVEDPFGTRWAISTHVEDVPQDEMEKRAKAAMANQK